MSLLQKYESEVEQFVAVCHRLAKNMYVTGYGGNLAWKLEEDLLLITPTQMNKGDIQPQDVVFINLAGNRIEGTRRSTGETPMYLKFFNERPDIVSVLHCHPPSVCAMAIMDGPNWLMRPLYPETTTEIGPVPLVPYGEPLTIKLAQNFAPFLQKYNSFIMENHGLVTMSLGDIKWTLLNVEVLEATAQMILLALQSGQGIKELNRQQVIDLGNVMASRSLPLFGAPGVNKTLESLYF
ncbi:MAG: class II aldolase/adducin family protein [Anaerolineae bacterium]|nr:class II aldolase/adducin family protein [Anaerolineae bacterium]